MADIVEAAKGRKGASGLRAPSQYSTIAGPGVRTNNRYSVEKQPKLSMTGRKNKQ